MHPTVPGVSINTFVHMRTLAGPSDRIVVRPNNDALYSIAWLDLKTEPLVLHVPDTTGGYYLMQILDGWPNVFANPGTRTTGSAAQDFVIAGPSWNG